MQQADDGGDSDTSAAAVAALYSYLFNTLIIIFIFIKSMSLLRLCILSSQRRSNSAAICGKGMFCLI
jgi:hypothetical protein